MNVERLRKIISSLGTEPSSLDLVETLWLALLIGDAPSSQPPREVEPEADAALEPALSPDPSVSPKTQIGTDDSAPVSPLLLHPAQAVAVSAGEQAVEIPVPRAVALTERLKLQRALRPLRRIVATGQSMLIDETQTAEQLARQELPIPVWPPVWQTATERWLDVAVIADGSDSMLMWRELAQEFTDTLAQTGIFRNVSRYRLRHHTSAEVELESWNGRARRPAQLIDPTGRRLVLVVSDCTGPGWYSGAVARILNRWGSACPIAIVQVLPERLWPRTGARTIAGQCRTAFAGAPNVNLRFEPFGGGKTPSGMVIPVFDISARWITRWARMLAGGPAQPGAVTIQSVSHDTRGVALSSPPPNDPLTQVRRFRSTASPEAVQLARYASLMHAPSLHVIQHIHQAMFRPVHSGHLAEMLLSGLLRVVDGQRGLYEFLPDVDRILVDSLTRPERASMRKLLETRVSDSVSRWINRARSQFTALAFGPGGRRLDPSRPAFAVVSAHGVRRLELREPATVSEPATAFSPSDEQLRAAQRLFAPDVEMVPFQGTPTVKRLRHWLSSKAPSTMLLTGAAGVGKTRHAMELASHAEQTGWRVWRYGAPAADHSPAPLLAIIDEADTLSPNVIIAMRRAGFEPHKTLVIGRSPGDWWLELRQGLGYPEFDAVALSSDAPDVSAVVAALRDWTHATTGIQPHWRSASDMPSATYMDVQFAVLQDMSRRHTELFWIYGVAASAYLEQHQAYWERSAASRQLSFATPAELDTYFAAAWLYGARDPMSAEVLLQSVTPMDRAAASSLARWIHDLYPSDHGYWGEMIPVGIGQRYIAHMVAKWPRLITDVLSQAGPMGASRAIPNLIRVCSFTPSLAPVLWQTIARDPDLLRMFWASEPAPELTLKPLRTAVAATLRDPATSIEVLDAVVTGLPDQPSIFADTDPVAADQIVANFRRLSAALPHHATALASALGQLAARRKSYMQGDALTAILEQTSLLRRLGQMATPSQAGALHISLAQANVALATHYGELGLPDVAITTAAAAVDIWREAIQGKPPNSAAALDLVQIGKLASSLGDPELGKLALETAVALYQQLYAVEPDTYFMPLLFSTMDLSRLAWHASDLDSALMHASRGVGLLLGQDVNSPQVGAAHAAAVLTMALILDAAGSKPQAFGTILEAIALYEILPGDATNQNTVGLANCHYALAVHLSDSGLHPDAVIAFDQSVAYFRRLVKISPARHRLGLAHVLHHRALARRHSGNISANEGRQDMAEAASLYRQVCLLDPTDFKAHQAFMACERELAAWS